MQLVGAPQYVILLVEGIVIVSPDADVGDEARTEPRGMPTSCESELQWRRSLKLFLRRVLGTTLSSARSIVVVVAVVFLV